MRSRGPDELLPAGVLQVRVAQRVDELEAQAPDQAGGVDAGAVDGDEAVAQMPGLLDGGGHEAGAQRSASDGGIHAQSVDVDAAGHLIPATHIGGGLHGGEGGEDATPLGAGVLCGLLGHLLRRRRVLGPRHHGADYPLALGLR